QLAPCNLQVEGYSLQSGLAPVNPVHNSATPVAPTTSASPSIHHASNRPLHSIHAAGAASATPTSAASARRRTKRSSRPRARRSIAIAYPAVLTLPIREIVDATPRARIVRLDLDGHAFEYAAGQAVIVGGHGGDERRPYSIAASPGDAKSDGVLELLVGGDSEGRAGTHITLARRAARAGEGPVGSFTFPDRPAEQDFVFIAGGTGIAPLRAMLRHVILGATGARHVGLLYSARTPDEFAYEAEFRALAARGALDLRQTITRD